MEQPDDGPDSKGEADDKKTSPPGNTSPGEEKPAELPEIKVTGKKTIEQKIDEGDLESIDKLNEDYAETLANRWIAYQNGDGDVAEELYEDALKILKKIQKKQGSAFDRSNYGPATPYSR